MKPTYHGQPGEIAFHASRRRRAGMSLIEVMIVVAIMGLIISVALPSTQQWSRNQDASNMARAMANAISVARASAMRTGNNHVVFLAIGGAGDVAGNPLVDSNGDAAAIVILDDGPTGAVGQNCVIDANEPVRAITADDDLAWGATLAGATQAPGDLSGGLMATGSTFVTPAGAASTWILFRPDGVPVAFDGACTAGNVGSGNGAIYFTNGVRDLAVVISALGGARVHIWDQTTGAWTS